MKPATIALAVAFALPTTFAIAERLIELQYSRRSPRRQRRHHRHGKPYRNQASEHLWEYSCACHA
jgi:hypothetical protein